MTECPAELNKWIDVSVPLQNGMVHWPGDPPYKFHRVMDQEKGDVCTVSHVSMGVHTGTHMDAPRHFIREGATIDQMQFDSTIGRVRVIQILDPKCIHREELEPLDIQANERLIFKTANSDRAWHNEPFNEDFIFIEQSGARFLADRGIRMVGVDYLSVGGFREDAVETHHALLDAGIWVIEGLDLRAVAPGIFS